LMAYRCRFEPSPNRSRQLAEAVNATGVKLAKLFSGLLQYGRDPFGDEQQEDHSIGGRPQQAPGNAQC